MRAVNTFPYREPRFLRAENHFAQNGSGLRGGRHGVERGRTRLCSRGRKQFRSHGEVHLPP